MWRLRAQAFALACVVSYSFAIALVASPQLHERLHNVTPGSEHECAATLLQSAGCDHHAETFVPVAKPVAFCLGQANEIVAQSFSRAGDFSRLEHAPPVLS